MEKKYHSSWAQFMEKQFEQQYMQTLSSFVQQERRSKDVFPPDELVFNAFDLTPMSEIKVVILGQDPYHNDGQAHGLAFSVPQGIAIPPSLRNIFLELQSDIAGFQIPNSGDLTSWAKQGVLLLNATLTVRAHQPGTHQKKGWESFTDQIIHAISTECEHVVFMLWGNYAIRKTAIIDQLKHLVLTSVHPSPLSAYRGFFGNQHFSKANEYLLSHSKKEIDWQI